MTDIPVIMSKPMVMATLREIAAPGTGKTETRRLGWQPANPANAASVMMRPSRWQSVKPGDRLWVRESLVEDKAGWLYAADHQPVAMNEGDPRISAMIAWAHHKERDTAPSIHMPRWASRLTLVVNAAKMERLWDISEKSCEAEGVVFETADPPFWYVPGIMPHSITAVGVEERADLMPHSVQCFRKLWMHVHDRAAWDANPEVVAVTFTPFLCNIDAMPEALAA